MDKLIDSNKAWELIDKTIAKIQNNNYVANQELFDELWKDFVDLPDKSIDINKYKNKKHPVAEINSEAKIICIESDTIALVNFNGEYIDSAPQIKDEHIVASEYISTLDNYC